MTALGHAEAGNLVHGVGFYASDEEFVRMFVPFCAAGVEAGEATMVRLDEHKTDLLRSALPDPGSVLFLDHGDQYASPPDALAGVVELVRDAGATRPLRVLGELPRMRGLSQDAWIRYEATVNHVLRDARMNALCPFDTRTLSQPVQDELVRIHHVVVGSDGLPQPNPAYEDPEVFLSARADGVRDPLEQGTPAVELIDPTPSQARLAVGHYARQARLEPHAAEGLLVAVSETVTNALLHGRRPTVLRVWSRDGRVVVAVRDAGDGPADPFAGLLPVEPAAEPGGLGLRIAHQLCPETALSTGDGGFTVRLAAG
jgi:anti-sigma regulatory factor (Ser/Thr protein kinase)